jgi:hypothetical protein
MERDWPSFKISEPDRSQSLKERSIARLEFLNGSADVVE